MLILKERFKGDTGDRWHFFPITDMTRKKFLYDLSFVGGEIGKWMGREESRGGNS